MGWVPGDCCFSRESGIARGAKESELRSSRILPLLLVVLAAASVAALWSCSGSNSFGPGDPGGSSTSLQGPCDDGCDDACDPRTQGYWQRQCRGLEPGGPGLHPDYTEAELRAFFTETDPVLADLSEPDQDTCEALDAEPASEPCERALKQFAAALLNVVSGRVSECTLLEFDDGSVMTAQDALDAIGDLILPADPDQCKEAADIAVQINEGTACTDAASSPCSIRLVSPDHCNPGAPQITVNGRGFCQGVDRVVFLDTDVDFTVESDRVIQVDPDTAPCGCDPPETGDVTVIMLSGDQCSLTDGFTCD